jgi:hypothetical protein
MPNWRQFLLADDVHGVRYRCFFHASGGIARPDFAPLTAVLMAGDRGQCRGWGS